jgi:hypothetical protein
MSKGTDRACRAECLDLCVLLPWWHKCGFVRPTSFGRGEEPTGTSEAGRIPPVSYMSSSSQAGKRPKLAISNQLLGIGRSPLPRPLGYSAGHSPSCPESSSEDCSTGCPERNPESCLDCCSASYLAGYLEENSASCRESCRESCSPNCSADCPENRSADSPESNLPGNPEDYSEGYSESCGASRLPGNVPSPTSLDENDLAHSLQLVA